MALFSFILLYHIAHDKKTLINYQFAKMSFYLPVFQVNYEYKVILRGDCYGRDKTYELSVKI